MSSPVPPESEFGVGRSANLRTVVRDGEPVWQLRCPSCSRWADIDDDQLHGRVSVEHSAETDPNGCGYHERRDWFSEEIEVQ